ncbi:MAG: HD domain-containing protein [Mobilitalea sp.]
MSAITELLNTKEYILIERDIENFVGEKLKDYFPTDIEGKTIHDSVWGSVEYSEWEMQIIDSPLFQRLRDINQVGLAMLTYPAARHSRFEHSLGVTSASKKMCERIEVNSKNFSIPNDVKNCIILAALLHDIGHCFYSHLSETIYGELTDFVNLRAEFNIKLNRKPKAHEILSFMIVNTKTFKDFFFKNINYPNKGSVKSTLFSDIGQMIIGSNIERNNRIYSFQTAIINGPFDADKLDYIKRDSLTAGLTLEYDIERLFTKILVHTVPSSSKKVEDRLVIKFNGVTAIEELTFCKIMLYSYIYYHQKVLISETMIKDYVYGLCALNIIENFADFLRYTDSDILSLAVHQKDKNPFPSYGMINLNVLAQNIKNRRLPKRCFEVSQANIQLIDTGVSEDVIKLYCEEILNKSREAEHYTTDDIEKDIIAISSIIMRSNSPILDNLITEFRDLTFEDALTKRQIFYNNLVKAYKAKGLDVNFTLFDIYIVFPKLVNYGSTTDSVVLGKDGSELMTINDFVKLDDWAGSFNSNKWRGYVFVSDKIDRSIAFVIAQELILKGKAKLKNPSAYLKGIDN